MRGSEMSIFRDTVKKFRQLQKKGRDILNETSSFWASFSYVVLFECMIVLSVHPINSIWNGEYEWILLVALTWASFCIIVYHSPHSWLIITLICGGNVHRFSQKFKTTATLVAKVSSTNSADTRTKLREHNAEWPYGEFRFNGEQFIIVELTHNGVAYYSGMRVSDEEFALAKEDTQVPVTYQLARGSDGPGAPLLAWV